MLRLISGPVGVILAIPITAALAAPAAPRHLTFEARVSTQEAIERVYYSYQLGATRSFEDAVPRELLERKVRTYLEQSAALAERWRTSVTAEMLQAELDRIATETRFPDRLEQIYRALGEDPVLIQECFARPVLVERLAREQFSRDAGIDCVASQEAEALTALHGAVESVSSQCSPDDTWTPPATFSAPYGHAAVWTRKRDVDMGRRALRLGRGRAV